MVINKDSSIEDHLCHMKAITNKLAAVTANVSEEDQVVALLESLPKSYLAVVTALEAHGGDITLQFATQTLLNEDQKRDQIALAPASDSGGARSKANSDIALLSASNHFKHSLQPSKGCYICGSLEHNLNSCLKNTYNQNNSNSSLPQAKISTHDDNSKNDESGFIVLETGVDSQRWLIDSSATNYTAKNKAVVVIISS
ncbi:uncharacterized protein [Watersipora subatra]|uniref:uncharacterized protein n=1 Tax=Watersipora subatra TaxID=2589382 RepID=UPI00355C8BF0